MLTNYNLGDAVYVYNNANGTAGYTPYQSSSRAGSYGYEDNWLAPGDPIVTNVGQGFWYLNNGATVTWVENFSVNP
jgi:hypothetical protein